jgi:hypothetical protein
MKKTNFLFGLRGEDYIEQNTNRSTITELNSKDTYGRKINIKITPKSQNIKNIK